MNVKAVIDTNVLVSAYWTRNSDSPPARVYRALLSGTVTAFVNDEIISEYKDVLHRPKFGFNAEDIDKDIAFIEQSGVKIHPGDSTADFPDPDDKVFFCTALAGDAHLVTGSCLDDFLDPRETMPDVFESLFVSNRALHRAMRSRIT